MRARAPRGSVIDYFSIPFCDRLSHLVRLLGRPRELAALYTLIAERGGEEHLPEPTYNHYRRWVQDGTILPLF